MALQHVAEVTAPRFVTGEAKRRVKPWLTYTTCRSRLVSAMALSLQSRAWRKGLSASRGRPMVQAECRRGGGSMGDGESGMRSRV